MPELNCNSSPHLVTLVKDHWTTCKGVKINFHSSSSLIHKCQNLIPYIYHPLQVFSSSLLMKTSCLRLKLVELNFLVSFNTDDQSQTDVANTANVITYKSKSSRWTFSIMIYTQVKEMDNLNLFIDSHYKYIVSIIRVKLILTLHLSTANWRILTTTGCCCKNAAACVM